jgi:acylphosphatase
MSTEARLFTVHGRVQGVWFRDSTRREAERLGIAGHAINLADGNVEVHAIGAVEALAELEQWLHVGPPVARVTRVDVAVVEVTDVTGFRTG